MSQVFLYTEAANIPRAHLTALRKVGIIPVRVDALEEVQFVDPKPTVPSSDMLRIALETINESTFDKSQARFTDRLLALLS